MREQLRIRRGKRKKERCGFGSSEVSVGYHRCGGHYDCAASTKIVNEWRNPDYSSPRFRKMLVIAVSRNAGIRRTFEPGDMVAMQMKRDLGGDLYADLIRIQEIGGSRNEGDAVSSGSRIQTLAGQVQNVNRRDNSFELDNRPGQVVLVLLSQNAREPDRDRLRTLRAGEHVRIEGKFTELDKFELLSFLNDDS